MATTTTSTATRTDTIETSDTRNTNSDSSSPAANASYEDELSREFRFARFIVECPCLLCCIMIFIIFTFCIIFGALFDLTLTNLRAGFPDNNDEYVLDFDAYSLAAEFVEYDEEERVNRITQSEEIDLWQYIMFFELNEYKNDFDFENPSKTDYWLLTPENIKTIIKYEDKIYLDKEWNDKFCWVGNDPMETNYTCNNAIISPAREIAEFYNYDYDSFTTEDVKNYTNQFLTKYSFCFNPGAFETGQIYIYRSFFKAGAPIGNGKVEWINDTRVHLTDYKNSEDQLNLQSVTGQMGEYYKWGFPLYQDIIIDHDANLVDGNVAISLYCPSIHGNYVWIAFGNSIIFLILAILVVWGYMTYHLHSLFLSSGAIFGILMSFPSAYFVYRVIFQIPIFDALSTLIVFVLLGVGADDVFVFTDAWTQSASFVGAIKTKPEDLKKTCCGCENTTQARDLKRMSFTFRRAAMAMLVTQVTTFFAFLATAASILINMSAFGIWAACVVMMNYVLVITLYPAVLMIHHKYIKKYEEKICCCCCNLICSKKKKKISQSPPQTIKPQLSRQSSVLEISQQYGKFESFLGMKWSSWMIKFKYYILSIFFILFILTAIGTFLLETASNVDNAFEDDHWFVESQNNLYKFTASETDSLVSSHITFGIAGVNKDGVKKYNPDEYYGKIIWQNDFDISTPQQQLYLKYICNSLKNRTDLAHSSDTVYCPIIDFEIYLETKTSYSFPYEYNGNDMTQSEAFAIEWNKFLNSNNGIPTIRDGLSYIDENNNNDIKFYAIWFYTTLVSSNFNGDLFESYLDKLEIFINDITGSSSNCPKNLCDYVGNSNIFWVWISIINAYISSAVKGILIALPLAFIVMLLSTQNWIISLFALFDIIGVMLSELSIMYLLGYEFSLTESISTIVIIGFSVDYVVHLANSYLESNEKTRNERLSFALLTIGISVVSGAITTFLSGFFLIFAEFIFFKKMGTILMTTVLTSIIWAMCFFTTLCAAIGPQQQQGDLKKYFTIILNKILSCNKSQDDNHQNQKPKQQMEMVAH